MVSSFNLESCEGDLCVTGARSSLACLALMAARVFMCAHMHALIFDSLSTGCAPVSQINSGTLM